MGKSLLMSSNTSESSVQVYLLKHMCLFGSDSGICPQIYSMRSKHLVSKIHLYYNVNFGAT